MQNGFCECLYKEMDSTTERGKLLIIIDHYPECVEYNAALDAAMRMANDYPRLRSDFDEAMTMLHVANNQLKAVRLDAELQVHHINEVLKRTTDTTKEHMTAALDAETSR